MTKKYLNIKDIPSILWGESKEKLFIVVHGNMSNKEDKFISIFAEEAILKGYQVISFDLPEHGDRKEENYMCSVQNCVKDLQAIMDYAQNISKDVSILACSMGAYFSFLAYKNIPIKKCLSLSPVVDMEKIIEGMMKYFAITKDRLKLEKEISLPNGQNLYWDYYNYVKTNPIDIWDKKTYILYGENDSLVNIEDIKMFCEKFNCDLKIMEGAEHYFHTEEQLSFFKKWSIDNI